MTTCAKNSKHYLAKESWIIDGNYTSFCYQERVEKADQIILLAFSRWNCLYRAFKRYTRYAGKVRESMAEGCTEKLDWAFILWILKDSRSPKVQSRYQAICKTYVDKVKILRNQKELDQYLENIKG